MYASYDGRTYCTSFVMRGLLYVSYDGRTYCTPVMMGGHSVHQL